MKAKLVILIAGFMTGLAIGWIIHGWRTDTEIESLKKEYTETSLQAERSARSKEQFMQAQHEALDTKYKKEKKAYETRITDLRRDVRSGAMRLSVATTDCTVSNNSGSGIVETRAELDTKTADDLISIAADGDEAIRELNLCIDQYQALAK